jgi:signal transduction histidine kinase
VVRLPALDHPVADGAAVQETPAASSVAAPGTGVRRRVLIVDDNVGAAKTLSLLLATLGPYEVEVVHQGSTALAKAEEFRPDVVLLDIGMPGMNGYEVARELRRSTAGAGMLLVAVTGYGQEEDRRRAREAGFDEHLVKPPSQDGILRLLNHPKLNGRPAAPFTVGPLAASRPGQSSQAAPVPPAAAVRPLELRLGAFLRELGHEVGNAVHPFQLMVQILQQPDLDPAIMERIRHALVGQLHSLDQLVQDLRRVSKVVRGAIEPRPQRIDPACVARHAAERVASAAVERAVTFEVNIPEHLPEISADAGLLEQAVEELLHNAVRHTSSGGRVSLTAGIEGDQLCIVVSDTGEGLAPELLPHIFDVFVRGDGAEVSWRHLGLGLPLVRHVAEEHGGRIQAHSAGAGQGSQFTLYLPLTPPEGGL